MKINGEQLSGDYSDPSQFHEIILQEGKDFSEVQLMRTGKFMHPFMDDFEITEDMFKSFKKNFDSNVKKLKIAFDYSHFSHLEASGWITQVTLKENNTQLWVTVEWTPNGRQKILDKEYRYTSADFNTKYVDNETGKDFGATLNGAGLTNRPFIKDMEAVLSDVDISPEKRKLILAIINEEPEEKENKEMNAKELKEEVAKLSDAEKQEMGLIETVEVQLSDDESKEALEKSQAENKKLSDDLETEKKDREFSTMLLDGKAVEAQREAFMKNDVTAFAKLSELSKSVNLSPAGSGEDSGNGKDRSGDAPKTFDEAQDKIVELVNTRIKENKNLHFAAAHKIVLAENPELEKLMEAA